MQYVLFGIVVVGSIIYAANMQQVNQGQGRLVKGLLLFLSILGISFGGLVLLTAIGSSLGEASAEQVENPEIGIGVALAFIAVSLVLGSSSMIVVVSLRARQWIARTVIRSGKHQRRYRPDSMVHTTAIVLALLAILFVLGNFILAGGIEGLAAEFEASGSSFGELLGNVLMFVLFALIGVGLFIRRNGQQTLQRLGLNTITSRQVLIGAGAGFMMFWIAWGLLAAWTLFASPEQIAEQTAASEQLFLAYSSSLLAGFMLAITAAIGEEILFRGAIQPIFGIFWTSAFFVSLHSQYILTPTAVVIFGVAVMFGWLRYRFNTTTAIMAHFVYNFIPFLLVWTVGQFPMESVIR
ncbi:MAG: CPBP family intramembrane metalloprotease [Anaerolineae bacterium]|nr:CPBP family intramembrane metalloprotease [Anaerolineae bacterium]MDQ7034841.1 CPBP family intramembrane metalloprotease [Anaerolineae bacterium]